MAVREKDPLLAQVNAVIKGIHQDGTWQKVADRYFTIYILGLLNRMPPSTQPTGVFS